MKMEKVFLDANILFSLSYAKTGLHRLLDLNRKGGCLLCISRLVEDEAYRNLERQEHRDELLRITFLMQKVPEADPSLPCPLNLPDKDRPVFMAAAASRVDFLLTGDMKHFGSYFGQTVMGVHICTARRYLELKKQL